jgi:hypothetical protein
LPSAFPGAVLPATAKHEVGMIEDIDDLQPGDIYPAVDKAFAPGWTDPKMDDYDRL